MLNDPDNFLHSYCKYAAARAAVSLVPAVTINYAIAFGAAPWNLFFGQADENSAADPYGVVMTYPGSHEPNNPKVILPVQLAVYGSSNVAARYLANCLYRAFVLQGSEQELRMISINGFKLADNSANGTWMLISAKTISTPGQVGRDDRGRVKIVSKFDLSFCKTS